MDSSIGPANRIMSFIYRYGRRYFARELRGLDVEVGQFPFMLAVLRSPGMTQEQLSDFLGMDRGTTARSLAALETQGFVLRIADEQDKRVNHIFPTDKAIDCRERLFEISESIHEVLFEGFSAEEKDQLCRCLIRMQINIRKEFEKE